MGIMSEKHCCICDKKLGLLSSKIKLSDGTYLCGDCKSKIVYTNFQLTDSLAANAINAENYEEFLHQREDNLDLVEGFQETHKFFDKIHIDSNQNQIIIVDDYIFQNKKKLLEENPTVFSAADLAYWCTTQGSISNGTTVTGKAKAEVDVYTIMGFESPFYEPVKIHTGKIKAKAGAVFTSVKEDPKIAKLLNLLEMMTAIECRNRSAEGKHAPAADLDSVLKMMSIFKKKGYVTAQQIKDRLKDIYGSDRAAIREAKKLYDL